MNYKVYNDTWNWSNTINKLYKITTFLTHDNLLQLKCHNLPWPDMKNTFVLKKTII